MFKEGWELVEDAQTEAQVAKLKEVLDYRCDRRLTIVHVSEKTVLSVETVHTIVTQDLVMRKVCVKLAGGNFARNLDCDQEDPSFLDNVFTGD